MAVLGRLSASNGSHCAKLPRRCPLWVKSGNSALLFARCHEWARSSSRLASLESQRPGQKHTCDQNADGDVIKNVHSRRLRRNRAPSTSLGATGFRVPQNSISGRSMMGLEGFCCGWNTSTARMRTKAKPLAAYRRRLCCLSGQLSNDAIRLKPTPPPTASVAPTTAN